jgi:hypothetical protein
MSKAILAWGGLVAAILGAFGAIGLVHFNGGDARAVNGRDGGGAITSSSQASSPPPASQVQPSPPVPAETYSAPPPIPPPTPQSGMPHSSGEAAARFGGQSTWWEQPFISRPRVWVYQDYREQIPISFLVPDGTSVSVCGLPQNPEPSSCDIDYPPARYSPGQRVSSNWFYITWQ